MVDVQGAVSQAPTLEACPASRQASSAILVKRRDTVRTLRTSLMCFFAGNDGLRKMHLQFLAQRRRIFA